MSEQLLEIIENETVRKLANSVAGEKVPVEDAEKVYDVNPILSVYAYDGMYALHRDEQDVTLAWFLPHHLVELAEMAEAFAEKEGW